MSYKSSPQNPSTDDSILILLGKIYKALEALSTVDTAQRQRISLDTIPAGVSLPTVAAVTAITNALPAGTNTLGAISNVLLNAGMDREQYINIARTAYNTGIRSKLN